ncbi:hypothetical protein Y032_0010g1198 [Ancylostoma ceylanicum]|nr:hypothetical protein Y032_0010g1198 [Ancylostoma ceylanicum]
MTECLLKFHLRKEISRTATQSNQTLPESYYAQTSDRKKNLESRHEWWSKIALIAKYCEHVEALLFRFGGR